jgi:O-antigen ligase
MIFFRQKHVIALLCVLVAILIVVAQIFANTILVLAALACFALLVLWGSVNDMVIPVLLFFLPWAPLIKLQPGTTSIYTLAILAVLAIYVLRGGRNVNMFHIFPALLLFAETLVVKTLKDYPINTDYIFFFACLFLFPLLARERDRFYDFRSITIFFSFGIILAALTSQQVLLIPTIARYIRVHAYQDLTRLAGFYGDPNFYSAHITAALGGIMILLSKETKRLRRLSLFAIMLVLLYCGFLSVAKSFALVTICLFGFWILDILFHRGRISVKLLLLFSIMVGGMFILSSTLFTDLIDMMIERFVSSDGNISQLTTGRTDLWLRYLNAFDKDPLLLWFGEGYTSILIEGRSSHNTVLQSVYQAGLAGAMLLGVWALFYIRSVLKSATIRTRNLSKILILLMGAMGPWMALDMLFFYEFFLMPFYVCIGINYLEQSEEAEQEMTPKLAKAL